MANFNTHLVVAALAGTGFAGLALGAGLATPGDVAVLVVLTTVGGLLPDIDLDYAIPTQLLFTSLGLIAAFMLLTAKAADVSIVELWLAVGFTYVVIRYPFRELFNRYTVHRGIFHSLVAVLFFCFLTTVLAHDLFNASGEMAWMAGIAVGLGYFIHLLLDEICSIDFFGKGIKRSFGTAVKPFSRRDLNSSALMGGATALAFLMTSEISPLLERLNDPATLRVLVVRFWPDGAWFNF